MILERSKSYRLWAAAALFTLFSSSTVQGMTADEYLTRAQALKAKGMMAVFHKKEIDALVGETKIAAEAYKADREKAKASGDTSLGCPPAPGSAAAKDAKNRMSTDQYLAWFAAIPKEERQRMTFKAAYYDLLKSRFPCPASPK